MADPLAEIIAAMAADGSMCVSRIITSVSPLKVDVNGTAVPVLDSTGGDLLRVGDTGLVLVGSRPRLIRNLTPPAPRGTVTALGTNVVTVSVGGLSATMPYAYPSPAVGDTVAIVWRSGGQSYAAGRFSTASPPASTAPTATPPASTAPAVPVAPKLYTSTFSAIATSSSSGGSWTTWGDYDTTAVQGTYSGSNYKSGYYFYGQVFGGAAGRTCTAATLRLRRGSSGLGSSASIKPHLRLHTGAIKGAAPPALTADAGIDGPGFTFGQELVFDLGATWGQKLLNGSAAGIALVYSGTADYAQWLGVASMAAAGQLTLTIQEA